MHKAAIARMMISGILAASVPLVGCASQTEAEEELSSSEDNLLGLDCSPETMIENAPEDRKAILRRASKWIESPVSYSLTEYQDGYRKDCSGFVSMAWGLGDSITTAQIPPRSSSTAYAEPIAWEDLQPGDAVSKNTTSQVLGMTVGHVRLYAGKNSIGRMCFWEQTYFPGVSYWSGTQTHTYSQWRLQLESYTPIRKN
jgi:hypothetical protein